MPEVVTRLTWKYTRQCTHTHVSGRRCGIRVPKDRESKMCHPHEASDCSECRSMMAAFKPPKGWHI